MSQSGCTSALMNSELMAFTATCVVCEAGSRGQKSSDERASTVSFSLVGLHEMITLEPITGTTLALQLSNLHQKRETHLYRSLVEWHMQLMQALPGKCSATESSSAAW